MDPVPQCSCSFPPTLPTTPVRQRCPGVGMYGLHSRQFKQIASIQKMRAHSNLLCGNECEFPPFLLQKEGVQPTAGLPAESITVFCRRVKLIIVIIEVPSGLLSDGAAVPRIHGWRGSTRCSLLPQRLPLWVCARVCMCACVVAGTAFIARGLQSTEGGDIDLKYEYILPVFTFLSNFVT